MIVNGKEITEELGSIHALLTHLGLSMDRVVIEINGSIVSKNLYDDYSISHNDVIEIVSFVGGG